MDDQSAGARAPLVERLETHLHSVEARLHERLENLDGPLGDLVRPQLGQIRPLLRAAMVLTTAYALHTHTSQELDPLPPDTREPVAQERIEALAAAVEMLYIALRLHERLLRAEPATQVHDRPVSTIDKTFLGSTILAGDYCFSRASQLAAETEHPQVVAHFAQTLQALSEGLLRQEFKHTDGPSTSPSSAVAASIPSFDKDALLTFAGVEGTLYLFNLPVDSPMFPTAEQALDSTHNKIAPSSPSTAELENSVHWQMMAQAQRFFDTPADAVAPPTKNGIDGHNPKRNTGHGEGQMIHSPNRDWQALAQWWQRASV